MITAFPCAAGTRARSSLRSDRDAAGTTPAPHDKLARAACDRSPGSVLVPRNDRRIARRKGPRLVQMAMRPSTGLFDGASGRLIQHRGPPWRQAIPPQSAAKVEGLSCSPGRRSRAPRCPRFRQVSLAAMTASAELAAVLMPIREMAHRPIDKRIRRCGCKRGGSGAYPFKGTSRFSSHLPASARTPWKSLPRRGQGLQRFRGIGPFGTKQAGSAQGSPCWMPNPAPIVDQTILQPRYNAASRWLTLSSCRRPVVTKRKPDKDSWQWPRRTANCRLPYNSRPRDGNLRVSGWMEECQMACSAAILMNVVDTDASSRVMTMAALPFGVWPVWVMQDAPSGSPG